jgi:hypothetical protein
MKKRFRKPRPAAIRAWRRPTNAAMRKSEAQGTVIVNGIEFPRITPTETVLHEGQVPQVVFVVNDGPAVGTTWDRVESVRVHYGPGHIAAPAGV